MIDPIHNFDFGGALVALRQGARVARSGWNGKGIFIKVHVPIFEELLSTPYIYIDTTGLDTDNPDAPMNRVPWVASQADLLSLDWGIVD